MLLDIPFVVEFKSKITMRQLSIDRAIQTFQKYRLNLDTVNCIDIGGTEKVYLETNRLLRRSPQGRLKSQLLKTLQVEDSSPREVITAQNPLIQLIPQLKFFDQGFNAEAIDTSSDIEGDFLNRQCVEPLLNSFDLVTCFDTLEHVSDPFTFCQHLIEIAKPGGYVYLATVFLWEYHPSPKDYFRFSPDGLRECFSKVPAKLLECDWDDEGVSVFAFLQKD
jgi:SAM-dependent methyltransferase